MLLKINKADDWLEGGGDVRAPLLNCSCVSAAGIEQWCSVGLEKVVVEGGGMVVMAGQSQTGEDVPGVAGWR